MRDLFVSLSKPKVVPVEIDGHTFYVKAMDYGTFCRVRAADDDAEITLTLLACVCHADGSRVFGDDDAALVQSLPCSIVGPLNKAAQKASGFDPDPKG